MLGMAVCEVGDTGMLVSILVAELIDDEEKCQLATLMCCKGTIKIHWRVHQSYVTGQSANSWQRRFVVKL